MKGVEGAEEMCHESPAAVMMPWGHGKTESYLTRLRMPNVAVKCHLGPSFCDLVRETSH